MSDVLNQTEDSKSKKSIWITLCLLTLPPLFWAGNFIVGRSVKDEIPSVTLSFDRWVIASLILLPFTLSIVKRELPLYWRNRWLILLASVTGITAFNSLVYLGLQSTTANNGMILNSFIPLLISLFGVVFFKLRLGLKQWLGMAISFIGVFTIILHGDLSVLAELDFNHGDLIIVAAIVCWAVYTMTLKQMPRDINRFGLMSVQMFVGLICLSPFFVVELQAGLKPVWNLHSILSLVYVSIVPSVLAYLLYTASVVKLGPARAGLSIHLIPVFGVFLSILFLGEGMHLYQLLGMSLIFLGILLS